MAAVGVGIVLTRETLQVRWRAWIVDRLLGTWLARDRYYHLGITHTEPANPEYRIADDTRWATEPLVDLAIGLFSALTGAAAFISILWSVGGSLDVYGCRRGAHHPGLYGAPGAGLRRLHVGPHAVCRPAAGLLLRAQERGRRHLPFRPHAPARECRKRCPAARRREREAERSRPPTTPSSRAGSPSSASTAG